MNIPVHVEPVAGALAPVDYRWDKDTDILTAHVHAPPVDGASGSVDVEGNDGSWLIFDVSGGRIRSVEVAVWPTVRKRSELVPPQNVEDAAVTLGKDPEAQRVSALEVNTVLAADADPEERTIHFRLGPGRTSRTVRIARQILLDLDGNDRLIGVWLLDVPPFPDDQ